MAITLNGSAGVTTNSGAVYDSLQRGTAVASTSGTSIDFTGIPSWAKRITVMFNEVSTNGTSHRLIQLGAGSVTTSGYVSTSTAMAATVSTVNSTAGFIFFSDTAAALNSGIVVIANVSSNIWSCSGNIKLTTSQQALGCGAITLGGTLDRIRITTVNGTDTFDAGSINVMWEG